MIVLKIMAALAIIALTWYALTKMHVYSEKKYGFPLFNLVTFAGLVLGWLCFFLAIYVLPDERSVSEVFSAIGHFSFPEPISNSIALVVIALIAFISMLIFSSLKTNLLFGPIAWVFQLVAAALIVPFLFLLIPGGKKRRRRRQTQYRR